MPAKIGLCTIYCSAQNHFGKKKKIKQRLWFILKDSSADLSEIQQCGSLRRPSGEISIICEAQMANLRQSGSHHLFWKDMFARKSEASSFRNQWQCNTYETSSRKKRGEDETLQWHLLVAREKINGDFVEEKVFKDSLTALTLKHKILKQSCVELYLILFRCCPASKKYQMFKVFSGRLRKLFFFF